MGGIRELGETDNNISDSAGIRRGKRPQLEHGITEAWSCSDSENAEPPSDKQSSCNSSASGSDSDESLPTSKVKEVHQRRQRSTRPNYQVLSVTLDVTSCSSDGFLLSGCWVMRKIRRTRSAVLLLL